MKLETRIVGATYELSGGLKWCDSMVPEEFLNSTDLDEVIRSFEETVDAETLKIATMGADYRNLKNIKTYGYYTNFRRLFENDYGFAYLFNNDSAHHRVAPIEFLNGELKFTITNPFSNFVGEIWVDPITKQVIRTESKQEL